MNGLVIEYIRGGAWFDKYQEHVYFLFKVKLSDTEK